tara:strand:- start:1966 stop:3465 length:1500 start_codon:yes stop_codon:yes gene_type:complete
MTIISQLENAKNFKGSVITYGHFNTIHIGHIRYLKHASNQGSSLIIALIGDIKDGENNRYQFNQIERAESLALLNIADAIILLKSNELSEVIRTLNPNLLLLGTEFKNHQPSEISSAIKLIKSNKGNVQFHAGEVHYATTSLLSSSKAELLEQRHEQFRAACKRQKLDLKSLLNSIKSWNSSKLIVIGDTILDQYVACEAIGMSAEAPVVVVRELDQRNFIGGAAIVASHIRSLGATCDLISIVGKDSIANIVRNELSKREIGDFLIQDSSRPTTFKKRYLVEDQKLFRVSRLEDHRLCPNIENQLIKKLEQSAPSSQGIVVSDFVYGVITSKVLEAIESLAKKYKLHVFGDLQCSSQVGLVTKFNNFSLISPNEREARVALQDKETGIERIAYKLLEKTNSERLVMKLGPEGFIAYDKSKPQEVTSQAFPALSVSPLDVTGAGDSLLAVMSTGLASKQGTMATAALGCCMASLAVEAMGNTPINADSLANKLKEVLGE